jgi:deoxyribodipyrimidine photolyase-like uncharacterized protein
VTQDVIALVRDRFGSHFGDPEPFWFATDRQGALDCLRDFVRTTCRSSAPIRTRCWRMIRSCTTR